MALYINNCHLLVASIVFLDYHFAVFALNRLNKFLHARHKSVIFIIECNDL